MCQYCECARCGITVYDEEELKFDIMHYGFIVPDLQKKVWVDGRTYCKECSPLMKICADCRKPLSEFGHVKDLDEPHTLHPTHMEECRCEQCYLNAKNL